MPVVQLSRVPTAKTQLLNNCVLYLAVVFYLIRFFSFSEYIYIDWGATNTDVFLLLPNGFSLCGGLDF